MNKSLKKALFIVFEGIDGTGKSTQIQLLSEYLNDKGISNVTLKEPTDGFFGKQARALSKIKIEKEKELELFLSDRKENIKQNIIPSIEKGISVIQDRYFYSTIAYQGASGIDINFLVKKNLEFVIIPDIVFILNISVEEAIRRITNLRGDELDNFEKKEKLIIVKSIFDQMNFPEIVRINAERNISEVFNTIKNEVEKLFNQV